MVVKTWGERYPDPLLVGMQRGTTILEDNKFFRNRKTYLPYNPAIPLVGIYAKKMKSTYKTVICNPVFIEAPFTLAKIWTQLRYASADDWIRK